MQPVWLQVCGQGQGYGVKWGGRYLKEVNGWEIKPQSEAWQHLIAESRRCG